MPEFTRSIYETNDCHTPAGSSKGGQFCSDTGRPSTAGEDAYEQHLRSMMHTFDRARRAPAGSPDRVKATRLKRRMFGAA